MPAATELAPPAPADALPVQTGTAVKAKKSKGTTARGPTAMPKSRGTGFEEYYAEPPLTPAEHEEEMELYDPVLPFHERIETCLTRYRARRRLDNERSLLLNRYLSLGGIDCQPRQFNGTADLQRAKADTDLSRSDARTLTSTDVVPRGGAKDSKYYSADHASLWTVDFAGVVSGYLSQSLPALAADSESRLAIGIDVVDNFLRYLQLHDVCVEYADEINDARAICARARSELPDCLRARLLLPGAFHRACVRLFYRDPEHTAFNDGIDPRDHRLTPDAATAKTIYEDLTGEAADRSHIVSTQETDLEIVELVGPTTMPRGVTAQDHNPVPPHWEVTARPCVIEEGYANQPHPSAAQLAAVPSVCFWLDEALARLLRRGTKLRVVHHRLNTDWTFVSTVKDVLPSFYTFLPQELMLDWKEPRLNEREAPSVLDPDADADEEAREHAAEWAAM